MAKKRTKKIFGILGKKILVDEVSKEGGNHGALLLHRRISNTKTWIEFTVYSIIV